LKQNVDIIKIHKRKKCKQKHCIQLHGSFSLQRGFAPKNIDHAPRPYCSDTTTTSLSTSCHYYKLSSLQLRYYNAFL